MKKLLTVSVLAATLASTAVFAQQQDQAPKDERLQKSIGAKPDSDKLREERGARVLGVAEKASQHTIVGFKIAQDLIDAIAGQDNKAIKATLVFSDNGAPQKAEIIFKKKISAEAVSAVQEAALSAVKLGNANLGWKAIVATVGKGSEIGKIYAISQLQGDDTVKGISVKLADGGKKVEIIGTPVEKAIEATLTKAKKAAKIQAVKEIDKGKMDAAA